MYQHNHRAIANLENAATISRNTPGGNLDVANFLQELADTISRYDHELSATEMVEVTQFHAPLLVPR